MAVTAGDNITAAQFNGLQSRVEQVLGTGSGDFGYGQAVTSSQVTAPSAAGAGDGDSVTAAQMDNLRTDMGKCWTHQTGDNIPLTNIAAGDVIGADVTGSDVTHSSGAYTIENQDTAGGFNDYLARMGEIEANRFDIDPGEDTIANIATDTRTSTWNGTISCVFQAQFSSANQRRHFFNSGGQLRISSAGANGSGSKSSDWATIIANPGQVQLGYNYATITGSSNGVTLTSIGNYGLTTSYQTIMEKQGSAAVYAENRYRIEARATNSSTIQFRVTFEDNDAGDQQAIPPAPFGPAQDEDVNLDITVTFQTRRASGSNVAVSNPSVTVPNTLQ
jgi:hypothetical protein